MGALANLRITIFRAKLKLPDIIGTRLRCQRKKRVSEESFERRVVVTPVDEFRPGCLTGLDKDAGDVVVAAGFFGGFN